MVQKQENRYRVIKQGLEIITTKEITNGDVVIKKGTQGKIVYAQNQVSADIWLYNAWQYDGSLNFETSNMGDTQFRGIVLTLKHTDFAINYVHEEHASMMFGEEKLADIPYLQLGELKHTDGLYYKNDVKCKEYRLEHIIDNIENNFSKYVETLDLRETHEDDNVDVDYILTDHSIELFEVEIKRILDAFILITGVYYGFMGGLVEG